MVGARGVKLLLSFVILSTLGLQIFATFRLCSYLPQLFPPASQLALNEVCAPRLWPFLTYPMYRDAHYAGDQIVDYRAYAVLADSTEVHVSPEEMGVGFWKFLQDFVPAMQKNDRRKISDYASAIQQRYDNDLVGLRLEVQPRILQRNGVRKGATEVVADVQLDTGILVE